MSLIEPSLFRQAAELLRSWHRPLIVTHARPDGDGIGAVLAMRSLTRGLGTDPLAVLLDPMPAPYAFLDADDPVGVLGREVSEADVARVDGVLVVDTCAYAQLRPLERWLREASPPLIAVDHHVTRDLPADIHLVDTSAAAASLIVYDWARAERWPLDGAALSALFVGIATDTGWFAFGNTEARAFDAAAALTRAGVEPHDLYMRLYQAEPAPKIRLLGAALKTLELHDEQSVAVMYLTQEAFQLAQAEPGDTEGIINTPLRIDSVQVSLLFVDAGDGLIRTSFRSKTDFDVAALASSFGGGGHRSAAGARVRGTLDTVRDDVLRRLLASRLDRRAQTP
jgi:phosphoesterase RecJ-like protein